LQVSIGKKILQILKIEPATERESQKVASGKKKYRRGIIWGKSRNMEKDDEVELQKKVPVREKRKGLGEKLGRE